MLKIKEEIRSSSQWCYSHSYNIDQDGITMTLAADTPEVRSALNVDMLKNKSTELENYITPEMINILRKYKCNYYIAKSGKFLDISYVGGCFVINIDGYKIQMYPNDSTDTIYEQINREWSKTCE